MTFSSPAIIIVAAVIIRYLLFGNAAKGRLPLPA